MRTLFHPRYLHPPVYRYSESTPPFSVSFLQEPPYGWRVPMLDVIRASLPRTMADGGWAAMSEVHALISGMDQTLESGAFPGPLILRTPESLAIAPPISLLRVPPPFWFPPFSARSHVWSVRVLMRFGGGGSNLRASLPVWREVAAMSESAPIEEIEESLDYSQWEVRLVAGPRGHTAEGVDPGGHYGWEEWDEVVWGRRGWWLWERERLKFGPVFQMEGGDSPGRVQKGPRTACTNVGGEHRYARRPLETRGDRIWKRVMQCNHSWSGSVLEGVGSCLHGCFEQERLIRGSARCRARVARGWALVRDTRFNRCERRDGGLREVGAGLHRWRGNGTPSKGRLPRAEGAEECAVFGGVVIHCKKYPLKLRLRDFLTELGLKVDGAAGGMICDHAVRLEELCHCLLRTIGDRRYYSLGEGRSDIQSDMEASGWRTGSTVIDSGKRRARLELAKVVLTV
ncbi:hypothetical protein Tco_0155544 [Tanacetum coccineum]